MKLTKPSTLLVILVWASTAASLCAPLGPILPPVRISLSSNEVVRRSAQNITSTLTSLFETDSTTSLAVQARSLADSEPLFEYYHTAPTVNKTGAQKVTSQTQFRIASVTKAFTILAMLIHEDRFDWRDPITKYVPELLHGNASSSGVHGVKWNEVTLDALSSQLGGIPRDSKT
jgi:CubicO group peptidase (beta-lactamase class C family)